MSTLLNRKKGYKTQPPYWYNPDISVIYELDFEGNCLKPGDIIHIKNIRNKQFKFLKVAHNSAIDKTWVDCQDVDTGEFRAFYISKIQTKKKKSGRSKRHR